MAANLIASLLSLGVSLLSPIRASVQAPSSSNNVDNSEADRRTVKEDLQWLIQTNERIEATLHDAEEREIRDLSVKLWLKELKRVKYAVEDVLSEYQYEVTRLQVEARKHSEASGSHKRKQMECIDPIPDGMVDRLNKIRSRFEEIVNHRDALQLRESDGARHMNNNILQPPTGHMVDQASIFGRDAKVMEVIDLLLSEKEKPFSIISIIGKGGLGKTTIAQLIYKEPKVTQCFDLFGWVCVSEDFNVTRMIKATIESVTGKGSILNELSPLQEELAKTIKEKRIFLVLDDVWNENRGLWQLFEVALKEAKFVRVLVTARNENVAKVMLTTAFFRPKCLPEDSCWQLFQHHAFGGISHYVPSNFNEIGRKIMRKCGGLPLAVKSIASLLRHEASEDGWKEILENDMWEKPPSSDIFAALQISYNHLPTHLKRCFLLCSMYPKDYFIEKMNLIELWISHGYVTATPRGRRRIAEIGVEYYEELKGRSLFDAFSDNFTEFCKLHDIVHDFARFNCENEYYSMDINQPIEGNIPQETYHLFATGFIGYVSQIPQQNLKSLRTLSTDLRGCKGASEHEYCIKSTQFMDLDLDHLSGDVYDDCWLRTCTSILNLTKLETLRVLELKGDRLREVPNSIYRLKHLSYLRITSDKLKMLPETIGHLYKLQTFILDCWFSPLEYLPESIGSLSNLRYLCIICEKIRKLPMELCSLVTLLKIVIRSQYLEELPPDMGKLCCLEELTICFTQIQSLPRSIIDLNSLMKLDLFVGDTFQELPTAVATLKKLKILRIHSSFYFPFSYTPNIRGNFVAISTMEAFLRVRTISWLKDMKHLEGELIIEGLGRTSDIVDAQNVNLRVCKIETLVLCWHNDHNHNVHVPRNLKIKLFKELDESKSVLRDDMNVDLLECLQPQPHLKKLVLRDYPCAEVPHWMGDPLSLQSIQKISLEGCKALQSLPFRNLHTLKHLKVKNCSGIRILQLEQLPSQLKTLQIVWCMGLESITGLRNLEMLTALEISNCKALRSITMDDQQAMELDEPFDDSSHEEPHSWQNISSLTRLHIEYCPLLHALPSELRRCEPCYVRVYGCSCDLEIGDPY